MDNKNSQKKDVINKEMWQRMLKLKRQIKDNDIEIKFEYVKAHNGHKYNERADLLATSAALNEKIDIYNGSFSAYDEAIL